MPTSGHVFISHNSLEKPQAIRLARALQTRGIRVWIDAFSLDPDVPWESLLSEAVALCSVFLACVGERGKGPWHERELRWANENQREVRLVRLPGWIPAAGDLGLADRQANDLASDWEAGIAILCRKLVALAAPAEAGAPEIAAPFGNGCPYPGIDSAFEAKHAEWFFGQERTTASILTELEKSRWVWLVGNSGSGKSSVARAGVMAWWPRYHGTSVGLSTSFTPTNDPVLDLIGALARLCRRSGRSVTAEDLRELSESPLTFGPLLRECFGEAREQPRLLLVIDQAEQLFSASGGTRPRGAEMLKILWQFSSESAFDIRVLAVLRSDWLPQALEERALAPVWDASRTHISLPAMDRHALRDAILLPARRAGAGVESAVVDDLADAVTRHPEGLPLLQIVLQELWDLRDARDGIIRWHDRPADPFAAAIVKRLAHQGINLTPSKLRQLVPLLVELDDRGRPRKRLLPRTTIEAEPATLDDLEQLVRARLVVTGTSDPVGQTGSVSSWFALAHDTVITSWPAFSDTVAQLQKEMNLRDDFERFTRSLAGVGDHALAQGTMFVQFEPLAGDPTLSAPARSLLKRFVDAKTSRASRERRNRNIVVGVAIVMFLLALTAALLAMRATTEADRALRAQSRAVEAEGTAAIARAEAEDAQAAAEQKTRLAELRKFQANAITAELASRDQKDPLLKALLLRQIPEEWSDVIRDALLESGLAGVPSARWVHNEEKVEFAGLALGGEALVVVGPARTPTLWRSDGSGLPTTLPGGIYDTVAQGVMDAIWSMDRGLYLPNDDRPAYWKAAVSPDGAFLAGVSGPAGLQAWDLRRGGAPQLLGTHMSNITSGHFNAAGTRLATGSLDGSACVWSVHEAKQLGCTPRSEAEITFVALNATATLLATVSSHVVTLWDTSDVARPVSIRTLEGHSGAVWSASFSQDSRYLVTASEDKTARVFDLNDVSVNPRRLVGHTEAVWSAELDAKSNRVLTASRDGTARVWVLDWHADADFSFPLVGHSDELLSARFSPFVDNEALTTSRDGTARLWFTQGNAVVFGGVDRTAVPRPEVFGGHDDWVCFAELHDKGRRVATVSCDGEVRLWDRTRSGLPPDLREHGAKTLAINAKERLVAVARGHRFSVESIDSAGPGLSVNLKPTVVAFSPSGAWLLTYSKKRFAQIWNASTLEETVHSTMVGDGLVVAAIGDDGSTVLGGLEDGRVFHGDLRDSSSFQTIDKHAAIVTIVAISSSGGTACTASFKDSTVAIWNVATGALIADLPHASHVSDCALSPEGDAAITAAGGEGFFWSIPGGQVRRLTIPEASGRTIGGVFGASSGTYALFDEAYAYVFREGEQPLVLERFGRLYPVNGAFLYGDTAFVTLAGNGTGHVWPLTGSAALQTLRDLTHSSLTPPERQKWLLEPQDASEAAFSAEERSYGRSGEWSTAQ